MMKDIKPLFSAKGHKSPVSCLAVSPDNKYLLSCGCQLADHNQRIICSDDTVCAWNIKTGKLIKRLHAHIYNPYYSGYINAMFIDETKFITAGQDTRIKIWEIKTYKNLFETGAEDHKIDKIAYLKSKNLIATGGGIEDKSVRLWDLNKGSVKKIFNDHHWSVDSLDIDQSGNNIVSSSYLYDVSPVILWNVHKDKPVKKFGNINMRIKYCSFLSNKYIVTGGEDKMVRIWNIINGNIAASFMTDTGYPLSLKIITDKNMIIAGTLSPVIDGDNNVYFWDYGRKEIILKSLHHRSGIVKIAVTDDFKYIVTGCQDGTVNIWKNPMKLF